MSKRMLGVVPFIVLVFVTMLWGSTFPLIKWLLHTEDPTSFLAVRFTLTGALMFALFWRRIIKMNKHMWIGSIITGSLYGTAQLVQTWGLKYTSASISGFVTGVSVIIVPFLVWVIYRRPPRAVVTAAATMAFCGLGIITANSTSGGGTIWGAVLCFISAFIYAGHIVAVGQYSPQIDPWAYTSVQMLVSGVIPLVATIPTGLTLPNSGKAWLAMLYMVVFASMIAVGGQTWAQRHIDAGRAAIIMSLEPVFSAVFAVAVGQDRLTWNIIVGGGLIVTATMAVEGAKLLKPAKLRKIFRYRGRRIPE